MPDIDVNYLSEAINDKADRDLHNTIPPYIKERYVNGTEGYTVWSDGYCEQWGSNATTGTITFLKRFKDNNVCLVLTRNSAYTGAISAGFHGSWTSIPTATGFTCYYDGANTYYSWKASDYLAEGEY